MTSDELRKSAIKSAVKAAREALCSGLERRLAQLGIFSDGTRVAVEAVTDQWAAQQNRPAIDAALARWEQQGFDAAGAVARFNREASYTWLNRLSAIRALEVRGLIRPIADLDETGTRPAIVATLAEVSPALYQAQEIAEALLWEQVFQELSLQLGALFDPLDPHGLFPDSKAVLGALQALSKIDDATWREDDTLGWLYQFFTTKEERMALRKKGAAFSADDLGPINQFYTPGWIVRFLTDNTLGALWRRMRPDTTIGEFCTLLLPRTNDDTPIPRKRVRDIKIIDPACGTMHFGVYAFDVLRRMYKEEDEEDPRDVPRLILEHNLAGIDIDRRAIQIAALNLYLKAAVTLREIGEHDPPEDLHLNLGCADAAPSSDEQQTKLRAEISDPTLREAVDVALSSLKYLHAVGSLLDVEADVRAALRRKTKPLPHGISPLPGLLAQVETVGETEPTQLDALVTRAREVAEAALRSDDVAGALVAEDAMLAAKVLRLVNQRYDVVLMNPPYGELMPLTTKQYLHLRYPDSKSDIYGAFFELAFRLTEGGGAVGALTSKTFLYLDTFKHVRQLLLGNARLGALIDGGGGILYESNVDTGAIVIWNRPAIVTSVATVFRLVREPDRESCLTKVISGLQRDPSLKDNTLYRPALSELRKLPTETIAYWAPPALLDAYEKYLALEPQYGEVRQGLATGDDERFLRYWWEVPEEEIGQGKRWIPFAKGGDYSPYYESLLRVIDWDARDTLAISGNHLPSRKYYFREGITFPHISDHFHARLLPKGCIFGHQGAGIFGDFQLPLLGFLNSDIARALLMVQSPTRAYEVGQIRRMPVPNLSSDLGERLGALAREGFSAAEAFFEGDELDRRFRTSWMDQNTSKSFAAAAESCAKGRENFVQAQQRTQSKADRLLSEAMGFRDEDWLQIRRTFGEHIREDKGARVGRAADILCTEEEHARRYLSGLCLNFMFKRHIVLLQDLVSHVRDAVTTRFTADDPDRECTELLKLAPAAWVEIQFAEYHLTLHKGRPRTVMLSSRRGRLKAFIDLVETTVDEIRRFLAESIEPLRNVTQSQLAAVSAADKKLMLQETLEDCADFRKTLDGAIDGWVSESADARSRLRSLKPLVAYVKP